MRNGRGLNPLVGRVLERPSGEAPKRPVAGPRGLGRRGHRLVLRVRLEDAFAHGVLRPRVHDRPEQSEAPPLAVDRVLPRRERDVPAVPPRRSQIEKPMSFRPARTPSPKCSSASASFPGGLPLSFGVILTVRFAGVVWVVAILFFSGTVMWWRLRT